MLKPSPDNAVLQPNRAATAENWPWHFSTARDPDCATPWTFTVKRLPESRAWHLVMTPTMALYNNESPKFLLLSPTLGQPPQDQLTRLHYSYLDRRTREPLHHSWHSWLWQRAIDRKENTVLEGTGRLAWLCEPDYQALAQDISDAIAAGELTAE